MAYRLAAALSAALFLAALLTGAWGPLVLLWLLLAALFVLLERRALRELWIARIFAAEFGQSDVQANYTRTYAWMANQLGHMTLGMGTALALVWLAEGLGGMLGDLARLLAPAAPPPGGATGSGAGLAGVPRGLAAAAAAAVALAAGLAVLRLGRTETSAQDRAEGAPAAFPALGRWRLRFALLWAAGAVLFVLPVLRDPPALFGPEATVYTVDRLRSLLVALGAAGLSLAVWGTKEFVSDQRGVRTAIARAAALRETCPARAATDELRREGLWDSMADGLFYLAGASIGVGVIASHPNLWSLFAESAWELFAVAVFAAVMLWLGQRYAYRAQAVDLTGVPYAFRLGLVEADLRAVLNGDRIGVGGCLLDRVFAFVRHRNGSGPRVHVLVTGAPGSGKTPFVVALACEAAMAEIPVRLRPFTVDPREDRVRVRYTTFREWNPEEAADPVALRNRYRTGIDDPVFVEGRLVWDVSRAEFVVVDDIPLQAVMDAAGNFAPNPRLARIIAAMRAGPGRVVWAIDPPRADAATGAPAGAPDPRAGDYDPAAADRLLRGFAAHLAAAEGGGAATADRSVLPVGLEIIDNRARRAARLRALAAVRAPEVTGRKVGVA